MKISFVLLFLLKILGFVLLILLAVLLLILLILLLTPIHYRLFGEKLEKLKGAFFISWFFRMVQVRGEIEESGTFKFQLRLFGRPFLGDGVKQKDEKRKKAKQDKKEKRKEEKRKKEKSPAPTEGETAISMRSKESTEMDLQEKSDLSKGSSPSVSQPSVSQPSVNPPTASPPSVSPPIVSQPSASPPTASLPTASLPTASLPMEDSLPKRVRMEDIPEQEPSTDFDSGNVEPDDLPDDFFTSEPEKKKGMGDYYHQFQEIPDKKGILKAVVLLIKRVLKGVLPNDFYLTGTVGTGDPASTGYLCGLLGLLKMKFGNHLEISADFKEMTLRDVKIRVKGKIVPGYFAYALLRFLFTKPVWRTVKLYWKGKR